MSKFNTCLSMGVSRMPLLPALIVSVIRKTLVIAGLAIAMVLIGLLGSAQTTHVAEAGTSDVDQLSGSYGWGSTAQCSAVNSVVASVGWITLNHGTVTGAYQGSYGGHHIERTFRGQYTIKPDRTGSMQWVYQGDPGSEAFYLLVVQNEIYLLDTHDGSAGVLILKRR